MSSVRLLGERKMSPAEADGMWFEGRKVLIDAELLGYPIDVQGDKLVVDSAMLELEKVYEFNYLDAHMILWRTANNAIEMFQVIEE